VTETWIKNGALWARLAFNSTPQGDLALGMVRRNEIGGCSIGYRVTEWEVRDQDGDIIDQDLSYSNAASFTYIAKRFELLEVSISPVVADSGAGVRSDDLVGDSSGTFDVIWQSINPVRSSPRCPRPNERAPEYERQDVASMNSQSDDEVCASLASSMDGSGRPKPAPTKSEGSARDLETPTGASGFHGSPARATIDGTPADDVQISLHESSHAVVGRWLTGEAIGGVTIVAANGFGGLCWGPHYVNRAKYSEGEVPKLCEQIGPLMPAPGESRAGVADIFLHCYNRVTELVAGTEGERLFLDCEPWFATDDERQAIAYASIVTSSQESAAAFISACRAEAATLLRQSAHIVQALASELRVARTMNGAEVDACIERAVMEKQFGDEVQRRKAWKRTEANAARLPEYQSPMRRCAARDERIGEAVRLIREGASLRWASEAVRLPNAKRAIARRCDQRGVARKHSPSLPQWETHIPDPVIVPPRK
jgi:hypothetical protein